MDPDVATLLRLLNEAQTKAAEEQRLREKADAKAAEADAKAAEADAKAAGEQRLREEADAKAAEEQRLREEAEAGSEHSKSQNLLEYLANCHQSFHTPTVITDKSSTTQGYTTDPTNRKFPERIVPWPDFLSEQDEIWKLVSTHSELHSRKVFPSLHQLDYVRENLDPISSENGVRDYARETVENHVQTLIGEIYKDKQLRDALRLRGKVSFGDHTNLGNKSQSTIEEDMEHMVIAGPSMSRTTRARTRERLQEQEMNKRRRLAKQDKSSSSGRKKVGPSDRFGILELPGGEKAPFMAIEYKPPHKFSMDNMIAGLSDGDIRPAEDVINKDAKSFEALSKALVAAVITQLFSDMIRKGLLWGYTCTAEANIFLHIPGEPSVVYCHLSIPTLDCQKDDENREYRTNVAQVSAFVLRAMNTVAPDQTWRDKAEKLPLWPVEYIDPLKDIKQTPEPLEKGSEYKRKLRDVYLRSSIVTRKTHSKQSCNEAENNQGKSNQDGHEDGDSETPDTPSRPQDLSRGESRQQRAAKKRGASTGTRGGGSKRGQGQKQTSIMPRPNIRDRPYCSHRCLLGLAHGGPMDEKCPNIQDHHRKHIKQKTFLRLIRNQLAIDRGENADCTELNIKGARGALFKVRLSSYGYTMVAKGVEWYNVKYLDHEQKIYEHIRSIQGTLVPVCLGSVELELPQYFEDGKYVKMLFLSWAGRPLFNCPDQSKKGYYLAQMTAALQKLHQLQVLHKDAESRNILWDEESQSLMVVDFERAELGTRQPLGSITPNRKRKRGTENQKQPAVDEFSLELQQAIFHVSRSLES